MKLLRFNSWLVLKQCFFALAALMLTGCFGGTVAQQLARSILMQGADKITAAAIDAHDRNEKLAAQYMAPKSTEFDDYQITFLRSGFETIQPQVEALPQATTQTETPVQMMQESRLVNVEVWNLLIGDEKRQLLEKARLQGSMLIPPKDEWSQWQIAVGAAEDQKSGNKQQAITFLIPPDIGKIRSGAKALVELPGAGELSIARYTMN